jgi:hypothetical protein
MYIATLCSYTDTLVPGEIGLVLIIAPDQRQAPIEKRAIGSKAARPASPTRNVSVWRTVNTSASPSDCTTVVSI